MSAGTEKLQVVVTEVTRLSDKVKRFSFVRKDGGLLPRFSGGAHTVVEMKLDDKTRLNPYSLMSDPMDQKTYSITVNLDENSRGGSKFMHEDVKVGDEMVLSYPVNLFSLDLRGRKHLMIAGGIGITPFLAQIMQLSVANGHFELHYAARSFSFGTYAQELKEAHPNNVNIYYADQGEKIDLENLLNGQPIGTHIYACGPKGMIDWIRTTAAGLGWPRESIHFEEFITPATGKPFEVTLAASDKVIRVGEQQSLLEAIEAAGVDAPYLCRGGACGQCETNVVEHDGEFFHHDHWLDDEEKKCGSKIMPCVSRFVGKKLVLDI